MSGCMMLHARSNRNRLITSYNTESSKTCQLNTGPPLLRIRGIFIGKSWTTQDMPSRWYETWCAIWIRTWMGRSTRASWMKKKSTKLFRRASLGGEPSGTLLSAIWCCCYKYGNVGHYRNPHHPTPMCHEKMENVSEIIGSIGKLPVFIPWHDLKALQAKVIPGHLGDVVTLFVRPGCVAVLLKVRWIPCLRLCILPWKTLREADRKTPRHPT